MTKTTAMKANNTKICEYTRGIAANLKQLGRIGTAMKYENAMRSFSQFLTDGDIRIKDMTPSLIENYEGWLRSRQCCRNTTSYYIRTVRAVYNRAVRDGIAEKRELFSDVFTGVAKTEKRALTIDAIRRIKTVPLQHPGEKLAHDMFMMSFYLRGMSFVDMAFLRKTDLSHGRVTYTRRKTGQRLSIKWTDAMQDILNRHATNPTEYLLPLLTRAEGDRYKEYLSMSERINRALKPIGMMLDLPIRLTMYCARHSWATAARTSGIPISVISEGLGHDSEATTQIYLASLDTEAVDNANDKILAAV